MEKSVLRNRYPVIYIQFELQKIRKALRLLITINGAFAQRHVRMANPCKFLYINF